MKYLIFAFSLISLSIAIPTTRERVKREAWEFADGVDEIVGGWTTDFSCSGRKYGYYGDQSNDCKIFHICQPIVHADGREEMLQWSFFCGNATLFDSFSQTCAHPDDAIPCGMSADFHYLNDRYGTDEDFHREEDLTAYNDILKAAYGNRAGK